MGSKVLISFKIGSFYGLTTNIGAILQSELFLGSLYHYTVNLRGGQLQMY